MTTDGAALTDSPLDPAPAPPTRQEARARLDKSLVHGIAWTGGMKWFTQILSWVSTIVVARLLSPADYGLVGMGTLYLGFVQLVNEFGINAAIIRFRHLEEAQIARLGGVTLAIGSLFTVLSLAMSWPIALFFGEPEVQPIVIVLSATCLISAMKVLPRSIMQRDLRFKETAVMDAIEVVSGIVVVLALALAGFRYWSLVIGGLVGAAASTAYGLRRAPHRVAWPSRWDQVSEAVGYGFHVVISRIAWWLYTNGDFAVVGRVLGKMAGGAYNIGITIASIPVSRISFMVGQVIPGVFSAIQDDPAALRRYILRITEGLAFITLPFSIGIALVAQDFVLLALGDKWAMAIGPLQLLACYASIRSTTTLLSWTLIATGYSRDNARNEIFALVVLVPLFYLGTKFGVAGVAGAWVVGYPIVLIPMLHRVLVVAQMRFAQYLGAYWPAGTATIVMTGAVLGVRALLPDGWSWGAYLAIKVATGAVSYAAVLWAFHRKRVLAFVELAKGLRKGR